MFVYTAKFSRKKIVAAAIALAAVTVAVILAVALSADSKAAGAPDMSKNSERVAWLRSLGREVDEEPLESRTVVIPRTFGGVYADYIALQREQGFPLEDYGGMEATRYTYRVTNWDGDEEVVADMIVYGQTVIAGDLQCPALDGFMIALKP
ncbi:MAG: DUF4830 domain-containing protein [Oscillospiraceae bacterium]|jgi:hypothetical protein|nr:DUF4830 domain-containing protein [Oscillospiraceae bacterium]